MAKQQKSTQKRARPFERIEQSVHLPTIIEMIEKKSSFDAVASWLQEQGECTDVQTRTLGKQINRFWKSYGNETTKVVAVVNDNRKSDIDEIVKLEELATLQRERIDQLRRTESQLPTLFPNFRQDIAEYRGILHLLIDKKSALGLYGRGAQQAAAEAEGGNVTVNNNTVVQNTEVNIAGLSTRMQKVVTDDTSRRKLLNVIEKFSKDARTPEEAFKKRYHLGDRMGDGEETGQIIEIEPEAQNG